MLVQPACGVDVVHTEFFRDGGQRAPFLSNDEPPPDLPVAVPDAATTGTEPSDAARPPDSAPDRPQDASPDAPRDAVPDTPADAALDAAREPPDDTARTPDVASVDSAVVPDLGPEAPVDAGVPDTAVDLGPSLLVGAGDIASCDDPGDEATALILDALFPPGTPLGAGTVITLGDNAYDDGTLQEYWNCYEPTWGRHKARTRPTSGNHEYHTPGAAGYFAYFGAVAGDANEGWYAYDLGDWRIYALNSECSDIGGCDTGSPQNTWLRAELAADTSLCQLAYWHRPRWSIGDQHGDDTDMQPLWQAAYDYGVDVVLSGHEHNYQRFAPQDAAGDLDHVWGVREFVVGTGGNGHHGFRGGDPEIEAQDDSTYGVLQLNLHADRYDWEFLPEAGGLFTDSGSTLCH